MKRNDVLIFCIGCVAASVSVYFIRDTSFKAGEFSKSQFFEGKFKQLNEDVQASRYRLDELVSQLPEPPQNDHYQIVSFKEDSVILSGIINPRPSVYRMPRMPAWARSQVEKGGILFYDPSVCCWVTEKNPDMVTIVSE